MKTIANLRRNWWRLVFAGVGAVAGIISYSHIFALVLAVHQSRLNAHLMPFAVDGLIVLGSGAAKTGQWKLGWLGMGPGLAASLFANVESSIRYGYLAATVAGWASVAFFLSAVILERWVPPEPETAPREHRDLTVSGVVLTPETRSAPEPVLNGHGPGTAPEHVTKTTPETLPAPDSAAAATILGSACAVTPETAPEAVPAVAREQSPNGSGARRTVTVEDLKEHYADLIGNGQLPSKRAIKADFPIGFEKAKALHEQLSELVAA